MADLLKGLAGLAVGAAIVCNLPTRLWMPAERATLQYLADASLQTVDESHRQFKVVLLHFECQVYGKRRYRPQTTSTTACTISKQKKLCNSQQVLVILSYITAESGGLPPVLKVGDLSLCPPCSDAYDCTSHCEWCMV